MADQSDQQPADFGSALRAAVRQTGLGHVTPGEAPTGRALLAAMGGVRGLVESILPGLAFLVVFTVTHNTLWSVAAPLALAIVFLVVRLAQRQAVMPSIAGIIVLAVSAGLALWTGNAADNFVLGFAIDAIAAVVVLVSILVGWPLVGLVAGVLVGAFSESSMTDWRRDAAKRRVATIASVIFLALFVLRLAVELPLYFAGNTSALSVTKLIMGVPLYALVLWVAWLLVQSAWTAREETANSAPQA